METEEPMDNAPQVKEEENCGKCNFYREGTCRKSWPVLFGDGKTRWATVTEMEWCGHFKSAAAMQLARETKGAVSLGDVAIVRLVDNNPGIPQKKLIALLQEISPGMSEAGAQMRITKLIGRGKLELNEDQELESKVLARGAVKNKFQDWAPHLEQHISAAEDAVGYAQLYRLCNEIKPIGKSSFSKMLNRALESGSMAKTDDAKYWMPAGAVAATADMWARFRDKIVELVPNEAAAKRPRDIWEMIGLPEEIPLRDFTPMFLAANHRGDLKRVTVGEGKEASIGYYAAPPKTKLPLGAANAPTPAKPKPAAPVIKAETFDSPVGPDGEIDWKSDFEVPTETKK